MRRRIREDWSMYAWSRASCADVHIAPHSLCAALGLPWLFVRVTFWAPTPCRSARHRTLESRRPPDRPAEVEGSACGPSRRRRDPECRQGRGLLRVVEHGADRGGVRGGLRRALHMPARDRRLERNGSAPPGAARGRLPAGAGGHRAVAEFVAAANAISHSGARPVFCDIVGPADLNLDPADVEAAIGPATTAILALHYGGFPCDIAQFSTSRAARTGRDRRRGARTGGQLAGRHVRHVRAGRVLQFLLEQEPGRGRGRHDRYGRRRGGCSSAPPSLTRDDDADLGATPGARSQLRSGRPRVQLSARRDSRGDRPRAATSSARSQPGSRPHRRPLPTPTRRRERAHRPVRARRQRHVFGSPSGGRDPSGRRVAGAHASVPCRARSPDEHPLPADSSLLRVRPQVDRSLPATDQVSGRLLTLPLYAHMRDEQVALVIDGLLAALEDARAGLEA